VPEEIAEDWVQAAELVRRKRFGALAPGDARSRARQMRFLQSRGFSGAQVHEIFRGLDD
jgi:regulatory protein